MRHALLNCHPPYILFYFFFLFSYLVLATPIPSIRYSLPHIEQREDQADSEDTCGFKGDSDTYGLGIRLSIYIQWLANAISYGFELEGINSLRAVANCFQSAMFVGLIFITVNRGSNLYAVEAFIVLIFCTAGGFYEGIFAALPKSKSKKKATTPGPRQDEAISTDVRAFESRRASIIDPKPKPNATASESESKPDATKPWWDQNGEDLYTKLKDLGLYIQLLLNLGLDGYAIWFVFTGMDNMRHPPCSTFGFFYTKVNLYGWMRTLLKVAFIGNIGNHIIFTIGPIFYGLIIDHGQSTFKPRENMMKTIFSFENLPLESKEKQDAEEKQEKFAKFVKSLTKAYFSFFLRGGFIFMVELMIKWNHIEGLYTLGSTGQLIPLLLAVGGLCTTADSWIHKRREVGEKEGEKQSEKTVHRAETPEIVERDPANPESRD